MIKLFIFLLIKYSLSNIIKIDIVTYIDIKKIYVAKQSVEFQFLLDLNITCIKFNIPSAKSLGNQLEKYFDGKTQKVILKQSNLIHKENPFQLKDFYFYQNTYNSFIGLGYLFDEMNISIVYQAYREKLINKLSFGVLFSDPEKEYSYIYLGGFPEEIISNKHSAFCNVVSTNNTWGCTLNSVLFNNDEYISNEYFIFTNHFSFEDVFAPKAFFRFLYRSYFSNLDKSECSSELSQASVVYQCKCSLFDNITDMIFIIGNYKFKWDKEKLIKKEEDSDECKFNMENKEEDLYNDQWIAGENFMKIFIPLFDYENKRITFYSTEPMEKYKSYALSYLSYSKILYIINIALIIIYIVVLLINYK